MNKDQKYGVVERIIYAAILALATKFVGWGYIDADMATYIAAGGVAAVGSAYAWWINRPVSLLNSAAASIPDSSTLVITTAVSAPAAERKEAIALASSASDKVTSTTT